MPQSHWRERLQDLLLAGIAAVVIWALILFDGRAWFAGLSHDGQAAVIVATIFGILPLAFYLRRARRESARLERFRNTCGSALIQGNLLYSETLISDSDYPRWKDRVRAWETTTAADLFRLSGAADQAVFLVQPSPKAADVPLSVSKRHNDERLRIYARMCTLRQMIQRAGGASTGQV